MNKTLKGSRPFPRTARLRKKSEFARLYAKGRRLYTKNFLLIIADAAAGSKRLGIAVSRKIDKRATVRNRLKRRLRELFRLHRQALLKDIDLAVIARRGSATLEYDQIRRQILGALQFHGFLAAPETDQPPAKLRPAS